MEFDRAKTTAYGSKDFDDDILEGDFGTWGNWRDLVLRVANMAVKDERERWHGLAVAFQRLDDLGFILSCGEEGDAECDHWLRIARESLAGHGLRA